MEERFEDKFSNRFLEIAVFADKGLDNDYGKGLARLQTDIRKYIALATQQARQEGDKEIVGMIKEMEEPTGAIT